MYLKIVLYLNCASNTIVRLHNELHEDWIDSFDNTSGVGVCAMFVILGYNVRMVLTLGIENIFICISVRIHICT